MGVSLGELDKTMVDHGLSPETRFTLHEYKIEYSDDQLMLPEPETYLESPSV